MKLFYSYSHTDEDLRDKIEKHLALLRERGQIDEWHDRKILGGGGLHEEIGAHLETSDIILLLLSADYLASPECRDEMRKSLELRKTNGTIVIPVIARPCAWKDEKMLSDADILAIPTDGKPITDWDKEDQAFVNIYAHIKDIVTETPFCLRREFRNDLTEVEFTSQHKKNITLDDLFVFPRVKSEHSNRQISEFQDFWIKRNHVMLKGDNRSGKTVIARKLFLYEVEHGSPTILISGSDITSPLNHEKLIERKFQAQFSGSYHYWRNKEGKLLILDDFNPNSRLEFIDYAKDFFERIIVVTSEDDFLVYFNDEEVLASFELLTIASFGHAKQEELIKRWAKLSDARDGEKENFHGKIDRIEDRVNSIILYHKIVPRYPFYILSILQTFEEFMPQNIQITAYGHCYQALITAQLIRVGIRTEDLDSLFNFLTCFAFEVFKRGDELSQEQFVQFFKDYENKYVIKKTLVNRLTNGCPSMIRTHRGTYQFHYPFIYYFFLGNFFARNYEEHKDLIEKLAEKSYMQNNANILIFTIHHAQDGTLIDTILGHTKCVFNHTAVASLSTNETRLLEETLKEFPERILSNRSVPDERRLQRECKDELDYRLVESVTQDKPDEFRSCQTDQSVANILTDFYRALKNMEILGQVLRNKYGSLPRCKLEEIIMFVTNAGLRLIKVNTNHDGIQRFESFCIEVFENEKPDGNRHKMAEFLRNLIRTMTLVTISLLLNKIVVSIRKPELMEIVENIFQRQDTPAYDLLYIFFLLNSVEELDPECVKKILDILGKFKKSKNTVAIRFLSLEVQNYANTHVIHFKLREKLLKALNIEYQPNPLRKP